MDINKIALEDEISRAIMAENGCTAHFQYKSNSVRAKDAFFEPIRTVTVMTYNPKTKETFLLKEISAKTDEEALAQISAYVKNHKIDYDSFTIEWAKKGEGKQSPSHFYCKDALEALEKFYFKKEREEYIVYNLKMNAKS